MCVFPSCFCVSCLSSPRSASPLCVCLCVRVCACLFVHLLVSRCDVAVFVYLLSLFSGACNSRQWACHFAFRRPRPMASAMFYAPWYHAGPIRKVMPREVWAKLSPRGQHICRFMVPAEGETPIETGFVAPGDAGDHRHRLSAERVHEVRNEFGGSMTGMQFRQGTCVGPKL